MLRFLSKILSCAAEQPGYIEMRMLKLKSAPRRSSAGANYQFVLTFASEALRQKWIATDTHKQLWPILEGMLTDKNYSRLFYEVY